MHCQAILERMAADASVSLRPGPSRPADPDHPPTIPGFVIERELGRGAMGVVYQAWQPHLARRVAIKVVRASHSVDAEDRRRWLREARAIGRLRHPHIVQIHEAGEQDGCLYLVLDLITGGSLAERASGPLPARVAAGLMATVARAVDQIHRAGMLHLDIKPSNILLDGLPERQWDEVTPMIADFGIARAGDDPGATAVGPIAARGTPSFMAPEQIGGDRAAIGPRSDVFALGATLYCLLTGRPPFQAASVIETLDLVRTREPLPLRTLVPDLARDLETIALTCLRKDPRRRYASAGALADDLKRWLEGFPIRARPVSQLERAARWCRRRPAVASLLAILAFTVASSLAGLLTLWRHSEAERARAETALARAIESDEATSGLVRDLVGLLATTVDAPQMLVSERLNEACRVVRELTAKLRRDRRFVTSNLVAVCNLECQMAEALRPHGKYTDARALLMDSLELLEMRGRTNDDPDVDEAYSRALTELVTDDLEEGHDDAALVWAERAGDALEHLVHIPQRSKAIILLDHARRSVAARLGRRGLEEERRKLLEKNIRLLEQRDDSGGVDPTVGLLAAFTRAELAADDGTVATLRAAIRKLPTERPLPEPVRAELGAWMARVLEPYLAGPNTTGKPMARLDPDAQADLLIRALESWCEALGIDQSSIPTVAYQVGMSAPWRGSRLRKAGLLGEARHTAACLAAFARRLLQRNPDEALFHLLLSQAFAQEAKNAWKVEDYATIEAALRKALDEARTALRLDSRCLEARATVAGLQEKLARLPSAQSLSL
jgi:serine/threonine protein kinase